MSASVAVLEEVSLVSPLGVRFWDVALETRVSTGLDVRVWPVSIPEFQIPAVQGPAGVYSFQHLPGMREVESGAGDDSYWAAQTPRFPFVLQVIDVERRYLPFRLNVLLPQRGIYGLRLSPPGFGVPDETWLPAFGAPTRTFSSKAMLRAQLVELGTEQPAAWALVETRAGGNPPVRGLADERGMLSMPIEWPEPDHFGLGSPIGGAARPWSDQRWNVEFTVYYSRVAAAGQLPDLETVLLQAPATVWADRAATAEIHSAELVFGEDLTLRSLESPGGRELPYLYLTPAGSPPI